MQGHKGNLNNHKKVLHKKLKKFNIPVIGCYCEVNSGWIISNRREALIKAVQQAKRYKGKKQVVIVTTSSDRFLRNRWFHTKDNPDVLPTEFEFEKFNKLICGIPCLTLLNPDMPWKKVRSYQSKWGQNVKGNKGGRPKNNKPGYKKQRRLEKLPVVLQMYKKYYNKISLGDISAVTGIHKSTVWYWVKKHGYKTI